VVLPVGREKGEERSQIRIAQEAFDALAIPSKPNSSRPLDTGWVRDRARESDRLAQWRDREAELERVRQRQNELDHGKVLVR
jgi:hypothetical protein